MSEELRKEFALEAKRNQRLQKEVKALNLELLTARAELLQVKQERDRLREAIQDAYKDIKDRIGPNRKYKYSRCVICGSPWWDDKEQHVTGCFVPRLRSALAAVKPESERPKIVCLCGSTRFYKQFQLANYDETMKGNIVLSVGFYPHSSKQAHGQEIGCTDEQKIVLDELHKRKIDLADEVLVLNIDEYIGESTRSEINYAIAHGKQVRYLEPIEQKPETDNLVDLPPPEKTIKVKIGEIKTLEPCVDEPEKPIATNRDDKPSA